MLKETTFRDDILHNKVKQSQLIRQSKFFKEQTKARYVMTKTNIYIFPTKNNFQSPSETIKLSSIISLKSYYKQNQILFRIETDRNNYSLICQNSQQRWSWMTAIERMIENQSSNLQSMKQAIIWQNQQKIKRLRQNFYHQRLCIKGKINNPTQTQQMQQKKMKSLKSNQNKEINTQKQQQNQVLPMSIFALLWSMDLQKTKNDKIVQEKTKQEKQQLLNKCKHQILCTTFQQIFEYLVNQQDADPKIWVDFFVFICISKLDFIKPYFIDFCVNNTLSRCFKELLLLMLNQETNERQINNYVRFLIMIYQNVQDFFYIADVKILLDILYRQLQLNRQTLQQYLIVHLLECLVSKVWWNKLNYRRQSLRNILAQLQSISGQEMADLITDVCSKI